MNRSIVIDREYGSGGREIARRISEILDIPWFDGAGLVAAAREMGFDESLVEDYDEEGVGSAIADLTGRSPRYNTEGHAIDRAYMAYEERRKLILKLSRGGPCVFLGRCADEVLRRKAPFLNVFVYATDLRQRKERVMRLDGVEEERLEAYLQKKDAQRRRYYKSFTGREWGARENYDLLLNTSGLSYDQAAEGIVALWKNME